MSLQGFWRKPPWVPSSSAAASAIPAIANGFSNSAACSSSTAESTALIFFPVSISFFYFFSHAFYGMFAIVLRRTTSMQRLEHIGRFAALPERDYRGSEWASSALFSLPLLFRQYF